MFSSCGTITYRDTHVMHKKSVGITGSSNIESYFDDADGLPMYNIGTIEIDPATPISSHLGVLTMHRLRTYPVRYV